ncbi:unnamed protein product [Blepharisma stoltei]|uniref:Uncharacterized protein n=1 Tax=Blepharisma stoltei TaxID=1481888 RepID=A0AAU9IRH2_9CILI|nr:unnamed protein product [Blepharisma stoltei]
MNSQLVYKEEPATPGFYPYSSSFNKSLGSIATYHMAAISADSIILIYDTFSFQLLYELSGHSSTISSLAWHPKEPILASGDEYGEVWIWDFKLQKKEKLKFESKINVLAWSFEKPKLLVAYSDKADIYDNGKTVNFTVSENLEYAEFIKGYHEKFLIGNENEFWVIEKDDVKKFEKKGCKKAYWVSNAQSYVYLLYDDKAVLFDVADEKEIGICIADEGIYDIYCDALQNNTLFEYSNGCIKLWELAGELSKDNYKYNKRWESSFIGLNPLLVLSSTMPITSHHRSFLILLSDLSLRYYSIDFSYSQTELSLTAIDYLSLPRGESILITYNSESMLVCTLGPYIILFSLKTHKRVKQIHVKGQLSHIVGANSKLYAQCQVKSEYILIEINLGKSEITKIKDFDAPVEGLKLDSSGTYLAVLSNRKSLEFLSLVHSNYENTEIYSYDLVLTEEFSCIEWMQDSNKIVYTSETGVHMIEVNKDEGAEEIEFYFALVCKCDLIISKIIATSEEIIVQDYQHSVYKFEQGTYKDLGSAIDIGFINKAPAILKDRIIEEVEGGIIYENLPSQMRFLTNGVLFGDGFIAIYNGEATNNFSKINPPKVQILLSNSTKYDFNTEANKIFYKAHNDYLKKSTNFEKSIKFTPDEWKKEFKKLPWIDQQLLVSRLFGDVLEYLFLNSARQIVELPLSARGLSTTPTPAPCDISVEYSPITKKTLNMSTQSIPKSQLPHKTPPKWKQPSPTRSSRGRTHSLNNSSFIDSGPKTEVKKIPGFKRDVSPQLKSSGNLRSKSKQTESILQLAVNTANLLPACKSEVSSRKTDVSPLKEKIKLYGVDYFNALSSSLKSNLAQTLLDSALSGADLYVNLLKACLISATQGHNVMKNAMSQAASSLELAHKFKEAAEIHILNENLSSACLCLQEAGLWQEAAAVSVNLSKDEEISFQVKWATKLYETSKFKCIEALLYGCQYHKALQILVSIKEYHKAAFLIILYRERGIIVKENWTPGACQYFSLSEEEFKDLPKPSFWSGNLGEDIDFLMDRYINYNT